LANKITGKVSGKATRKRVHKSIKSKKDVFAGSASDGGKPSMATDSFDSPSDFCEFEWLEMKPKGIVFEGGHFVFILENNEKRAILPLRYPVQTADLLGLANMQSLWRKSLGFMFQQAFENWDIHFQRCTFIKHVSGKHLVRLYYMKEQSEGFFESYLDQVLGLCLESQIPFYATRDYVAKSQILEQDNENFLQKQKWTEGTQRYLM
jgi:hypothetical protein